MAMKPLTPIRQPPDSKFIETLDDIEKQDTPERCDKLDMDFKHANPLFLSYTLAKILQIFARRGRGSVVLDERCLPLKEKLRRVAWVTTGLQRQLKCSVVVAFSTRTPRTRLGTFCLSDFKDWEYVLHQELLRKSFQEETENKIILINNAASLIKKLCGEEKSKYMDFLRFMDDKSNKFLLILNDPQLLSGSPPGTRIFTKILLEMVRANSGAGLMSSIVTLEGSQILDPSHSTGTLSPIKQLFQEIDGNLSPNEILYTDDYKRVPSVYSNFPGIALGFKIGPDGPDGSDGPKVRGRETKWHLSEIIQQQERYGKEKLKVIAETWKLKRPTGSHLFVYVCQNEKQEKEITEYAKTIFEEIDGFETSLDKFERQDPSRRICFSTGGIFKNVSPYKRTEVTMIHFINVPFDLTRVDECLTHTTLALVVFYVLLAEGASLRQWEIVENPSLSQKELLTADMFLLKEMSNRIGVSKTMTQLVPTKERMIQNIKIPTGTVIVSPSEAFVPTIPMLGESFASGKLTKDEEAAEVPF